MDFQNIPYCYHLIIKILRFAYFLTHHVTEYIFCVSWAVLSSYECFHYSFYPLFLTNSADSAVSCSPCHQFNRTGHSKAADLLSVLPDSFQFCAVLGSFLPVFAYLIVLELSRSRTAALITATLLIFGQCMSICTKEPRSYLEKWISILYFGWTLPLTFQIVQT